MMVIRQAALADSKNISGLVSGLAEKYITHEFTPSGAKNLLGSMRPDIIKEHMQSGYEYHVAEIDGQLVGVVAVRNNSHLYHLFVDDKYQNRGIARQLWDIASTSCLSKGNPGVFTVNSSKYARPVYEKFGFVAQSAPEERSGVIYIPMRLSIQRQK